MNFKSQFQINDLPQAKKYINVKTYKNGDNTFFKYWLNTHEYYHNTYEYCHNACKYWAGEYTLNFYEHPS